MKLSLRSLSLVACAAMAASITAASADTVAYTTVPTTETDLAGYGLTGMFFTPTENIDLTQLGFTAIDLGGGDTPHVTLSSVDNMGNITQIYDTGDILSSVTSTPDYHPPTQPVPTSTSYVSVGTPIELFANQTYLISAPAYWAATYDASDMTFDPAVSNVTIATVPGWGGWANAGYNFANLTPDAGSQQSAEVNFQFNVDPNQSQPSVPEPSTYALLGAGLALLALKLRRRTANAAV